MMAKKISQLELGNRLAVAAVRLLGERGPMLAANVAADLENHALIDEPAREINPTNGLPRWRIALNFQTIEFVHAGILIKQRSTRTWLLTDEGKRLTSELSDDDLIEFARRKYEERGQISPDSHAEAEVADDDARSAADVSQEARQEKAFAGIKEFIQRMDPYEFQNLVAALLRAMKYFIADIADRPGADGGVDIIAYEDPLGASGARLKVQVKHYQGASPSVGDLRALHGLLTEGEVGVFVCSSAFARQCREFARNAQRHLRLIDGNEFIRLWVEFHPKMKDEDKKRLPLYAVHFLDEETIPD